MLLRVTKPTDSLTSRPALINFTNNLYGDHTSYDPSKMFRIDHTNAF